MLGKGQWQEVPADIHPRGCASAGKLKVSARAGSWLSVYPAPLTANLELGGNNAPPLPWTLHSCVNLKLRELFHMSYQTGRIHISLRGWKKQHLAYRQKPRSLLGYPPHFSPQSTSHQIRCLPETQRQTPVLTSRDEYKSRCNKQAREAHLLHQFQKQYQETQSHRENPLMLFAQQTKRCNAARPGITVLHLGQAPPHACSAHPQ